MNQIVTMEDIYAAKMLESAAKTRRDYRKRVDQDAQTASFTATKTANPGRGTLGPRMLAVLRVLTDDWQGIDEISALSGEPRKPTKDCIHRLSVLGASMRDPEVKTGAKGRYKRGPQWGDLIAKWGME